jgi:3'(2'), 5'-bisphosphate nucleotidase
MTPLTHKDNPAFTVTKALLQDCCQLAEHAGKRIMQVYESTFDTAFKSDHSPITDADRASHGYLVNALPKLLENVPVVSEESESWPEVAAGAFWLVDPLDGTKEFLKRSGEFTVNIALIRAGEAVLGVVHAPALNVTYFASKTGGTWKTVGGDRPIRVSCRPADQNALTIVASKDHAGDMVKALFSRLPNASTCSMGSSLKFCLVAEGKADLYLRDVPTMEWDTAAAQCVVESAGGQVLELSGNRLTYGKPAYRNNALITIGDPALRWPELIG